MESKRILGMVLTIGGLALIAFSVIKGLTTGSIGSKEGLNIDAAAMILGWFAILVGPALWLGETPAPIRAR